MKANITFLEASIQILLHLYLSYLIFALSDKIAFRAASLRVVAPIGFKLKLASKEDGTGSHGTMRNKISSRH